MKARHIAALLLTLPAFGAFISCEDNVSPIGGSIVGGEVSITVDSLETKIASSSIYKRSFDPRTQTKLLGRINVPEYGSLDCSFVSQLMSTTKMNIPDSIKENRVDSMRMVLTVPRGSLTGDSLAPQQLTVYPLTKSLPADIDNNFQPDGYYDPAKILGVKSYTLSALALSDSAYKVASSYINIPVKMPDSMAKEVFKAYRETPEIFQWPSTFNSYFPGVYVKQNFGNGCIGLISSMKFYTYWNYTKQEYQKKDDDSGEYEYVPVVVRDSVCLFASQPEVLSANLVNYKVADNLTELANSGKSIITTPGGYYVKLKFPAQDIINRYNRDLYNMAIVSKLSMDIPAEAIDNDYDIEAAPDLLMVKSSERENFFNNNKIPDGKTSFYATYDSNNKKYTFAGMREYILGLIENGASITEEDMEFDLIPVVVTTETVSGYYNSSTYVTKCSPYIGRPTMTILDMDKVLICFTYSKQTVD